MAFRAGEQRFVRSQQAVDGLALESCTISALDLNSASIDRNRGMLVKSRAVAERVSADSCSWDATSCGVERG